ncbi:MAG: hypothetical protein ACREMN_03000 [Gemmatimonadales bacterium]
MRFNRKLVLIAALALPLGGCDTDQILEVTDPDILTPGSISGPEALPTVRRAAIGEFALAYSGSGADGSGGTEGVIMYSGLLGDEWINSETFPTRIEVDRRNTQITNGTVGNWFRTLSRARRRAEFAAEGYEEFSSDLDAEPGYAEVLALAGFTYLVFAENWCSGIPFSRANPDGSITYGEPLSTAEMLTTALARFDAALATATAVGDSDLVYLARVGRGRTLLDQGDFAAAATAVTSVPTEFVYLVTHSLNSARQNNGVFNANVANERYSVANAEAGVGLPYRTSGDPRISFTRTGDGTDVGFDRATPQYDQLRYTSREASVPLATGLEARLIEAEAAMNAGGLGASNAYLPTLNALRAAPPDYITADDAAIPAMGNLADPGSPAGRVDQVFTERAYWLWLTGHRLSDMRRLLRQYGRAENTVFATGPYFKQNLDYDGSDVNLPVPFDEENNPNFTQCADRLP